MSSIEIYLKSGHTIKVKCEEVSFTYNEKTLEHTGYRFRGIKSPKDVHLVPSQICGWIELN